MVDADDLWKKLFDALRPDTQIIFLGDINQLQPVFGASILNYAITQLPVVELKEVYRQKGDSTILENAHNILAGRSIKAAPDFQILTGGDKQFSQLKMMNALANSFKTWQNLGEYDPEQDIILSPFNKQELGTDSINSYIAQHLGEKRQAIVHEVIAGIRKVYLAIGDKVLVNKRVGFIKEINHNLEYHGSPVKPAASNLTRFGTYIGSVENAEEEDDFELLGYDNLDLDKILNETESEDKMRQASHVVTISMVDDEEEEVLSAVGDFSQQTFSLGYALTIHKAQGCEWRHVFIILHKDHSIMAHRELLYTAVTRASKKVYLIAKEFMIEKAIKTQRVKGNTLADKIEFFNAKISLDSTVRCYK
jgi:exodeoxyribonuclease V alpha subunit